MKNKELWKNNWQFYNNPCSSVSHECGKFETAMKKLVFALLLFPVFASAQECKTTKVVDKFSQEPKITTGFVTFNAGINKVMLTVDAYSKEIDFFFALTPGADGKCFDDASTAVINFEGQRLKATYRNTGSMNCEGLFHFSFRNVVSTPTPLQKLGTQRISSIKFTGSNKKIYEVTFTGYEQQQIMDMVNCIILQSKTLLK